MVWVPIACATEACDLGSELRDPLRRGLGDGSPASFSARGLGPEFLLRACVLHG